MANKEVEIKPLPVMDCIKNMENMYLDVLAVKSTVSVYHNMCDKMDAGQLQNAIDIIYNQLKQLDKYSRI